jgi:hypothetical protein
MLRPLVLLLAGLLLVLSSISSLQVTWRFSARRKETQHSQHRTASEGLAARLRGPWPRTIIAAGGVLAGFVSCFSGVAELSAL